MTNWPNIQEYRNFEAKLIDDLKHKVLTDSAADSDLETVIKDEYKDKNNTDDFLNNQKFQNPESKIVRCVIKKDFEETFKKTDREDGVTFHQEPVRAKPQEPAGDRSLDKVRLQNHLKWKKQKEEEYLQKKEAKKIAQQKKKEEELRLEKVRKLKEKEREEKLREWQEQKAREKEEKKREKLVIKKLGEELKVIPSVDKEKLIEEWVKLKNKQKQIEAEKKAELLRKEEENKALRQSLAELSYRQWKEKIKGRMMTLPKNGYQIFGPKPTPVVKEDWNHDFISSSPRNQNCSLRSTKSNTTATFTFCPAVKELEDFSKDIFYLGDIKSRSPSFCHLKATQSRLNLYENSEKLCETQYEMPLKELQPGTIGLNMKGTKNFKNGFERRKEGIIPQGLDTKSEINYYSNRNGKSKHLENHSIDLMSFPSAQEDQNRCDVFGVNKKVSELLNALPSAQVLPNKKRIDLYINTCRDDDDDFQAKIQEKKTAKSTDVKICREEKKELTEKKASSQTVKNTFREKNVPQKRIRSLSLQKLEKTTNEGVKTKGKKVFQPQIAKVKICRSQSCDKPVKKISKNELKMKGCLSSKSMVKVNETVDETRKSLRLAKSKNFCSHKIKSRKPHSFEATASKSEKKLLEIDYKTKKKLKRKNVLSKSFSFNDSPYCAKNITKSLSKFKAGRRKFAMKDVETKSDEGGHSRKISKTKI